MPILLAVSPFAAMRSAPVITMSTSPAAMREAAARVDDHRMRDADGLELEGGQAAPPGAAAGSRRPTHVTLLPAPRPRESHRRADPYPPVASPPALQWVRMRAAGGTSSAAWAPIATHRATSSSWMRRRGRASDRPASRRAPSGGSRPSDATTRESRRRRRGPGPAPAASARPYAAATPIAGAPRTASDPDRLGELGGVGAAELDHLVGKPPLVEDDDGVVLEPDDAVRLEVPAAYPDRRQC